MMAAPFHLEVIPVEKFRSLRVSIADLKKNKGGNEIKRLNVSYI